MLKALAITAILLAGLPVNGQKESPQPRPDQQQGETVQKKSFNSSPAPIPVNQQTAEQQNNRATGNPPSYFSRLFSPENLPNIGLFLAGVIGIGVGIATLLTIKRQVD